ncbi:MAG: OmpA family protein, partial [Nitrospira sp.]|nr:OmpA family protein [Nitrospira sp.]
VELNRYTRVEGHTDNVPIRTAQFPSNWELSAARAVMVVRVLSELFAVPSERLSAVGHADTRPVTANLDVEQRAKNRRVEVVILEQAPPALQLDAGNATGSEGQTAEEELSSSLR